MAGRRTATAEATIVVPLRTAVIGKEDRKRGLRYPLGEVNLSLRLKSANSATRQEKRHEALMAIAAKSAPCEGVKVPARIKIPVPSAVIKISSKNSKRAGAKNSLFPQKKPLIAA